MKLRIALILVTILLSSSVVVLAQESSDTGQKLYNLRMELIDIQSNEAQAKLHLEQLESDLKPENIERYFNGYGSTRPEELREARRKQLLEEKTRTITLLEQLTTRRVVLESAIGQAEARAYHESAMGTFSVITDPKRMLTATRMLVSGMAAVIIVGTILLLVISKRRRATATARR